MNSKIFILLVIGFQLIDASIIKKHDFDFILESNDIAASHMTYKYNKTFTFDILKTVKIGDYEGKQINCKGDDELCIRYGHSFIECTNKAYLKEHKSDFSCKFSGNKFSNVKLYLKNSMYCNGQYIYIDGDLKLLPNQCYIEQFFAKLEGHNPKDDKKN